MSFPRRQMVGVTQCEMMVLLVFLSPLFLVSVYVPVVAAATLLPQSNSSESLSVPYSYSHTTGDPICKLPNHHITAECLRSN